MNYLIFSFLCLLQFFSCSNNKVMKNDKFRWQAAVSVPSGYLADVYTERSFQIMVLLYLIRQHLQVNGENPLRQWGLQDISLNN